MSGRAHVVPVFAAVVLVATVAAAVAQTPSGGHGLNGEAVAATGERLGAGAGAPVGVELPTPAGGRDGATGAGDGQITCRVLVAAFRGRDDFILLDSIDELTRRYDENGRQPITVMRSCYDENGALVSQDLVPWSPPAEACVQETLGAERPPRERLGPAGTGR